MGLLSHKARQAPPNSAAVYVRHRPETTILYQIVQEYWPEFQAEMANQGKNLPAYVTKEFDAGNSYLTAEGVDADPESPMSQLLGSTIT